MDNKRLSKKFSTIFWWLLTIAPLLAIFVGSLTYVFNIGITELTSGQNLANELVSYFENMFNNGISFTDLTPTFVSTPITQVFESMDITSAIVPMIFSWAVWVQLIHILFDIVCWIPRFCHELLERF